MVSQIKQKGFTIVELLIVIVVIGILAAISIVAYNGVTQKARDDQRVSDARNIVNAAASYQAENGEWPTPQQLEGYDTISLSGSAAERITSSVAPGSNNKDVYGYEFCGSTGVAVSYYMEGIENPGVETMTAGNCPII